jgi:hypothetical protein
VVLVPLHVFFNFYNGYIIPSCLVASDTSCRDGYVLYCSVSIVCAHPLSLTSREMYCGQICWVYWIHRLNVAFVGMYETPGMRADMSMNQSGVMPSSPSQLDPFYTQGWEISQYELFCRISLPTIMRKPSQHLLLQLILRIVCSGSQWQMKKSIFVGSCKHSSKRMSNVDSDCSSLSSNQYLY